MPIATSEYVLWAYRLLLGREPENPDAINWPETSRREIVDRFLNSAEFLNRHSPRAWMAETRDFWFITELANGTRLWVRADDEHVSRAVINGAYDPNETAFVRRYLRRGMNVVDIGANIGWFTVNMAALVGPAGHVDAFEPREETAHYLQRTVAENKFGNVAIHRCALSSDDGYGVIILDKDDPRHAAARLAAGDAPAGMMAQQVPLRRLDSVVWGSVHFIKIAVAGAEKLVLDGADLILSRDRPLILSNINNELLLRVSGISGSEYVRYFEDLDYEVRTILPGGRCGERLFEGNADAQAGGLSVACLPAEKVAELTSDRG